MYTLRFPFVSLREDHVIADERVEFETNDGLRVSLDKRHHRHILEIVGFDTKAAAELYVENVRTGLTWLLLQREIAVGAEYELQEALMHDLDPREAAKNLSESFGGFDFGDEIHGDSDDNLPVVHPTDVTLSHFTPSKLRITSRITDAGKFIKEGMEVPEAGGLSDEQKLQTAFELFNESYAETSLRAKFLTLVLALEALFQPKTRPPAVQEFLKHFSAKAKKLEKESESSDEAEAFSALAREMHWRGDDSKRTQLKRLVQDTLRDDPDVQDVAKEASRLYDKRGTLVHEGYLPEQELAEVTSSARDIVRRILTVRFRRAVGIEKHEA